MLTREQILQSDDLPRETVPVPEWGGEVVMHTLETVAALQDLAEQTGASATALSGFAPVATISGVAMEQIGVGLTKLSKGLAGVDDETKGASQALQFLGVKAKDAGGNLRDPAEVMNDIALKLSNFEDGAGKTAIALELFGKSGAGLLPFLKDSFGDGYEQRLAYGINTQPEVWSLEFRGKSTVEAAAIDNFLRARGAVQSFDWTTPSGITGKFLCEEWSRSIEEPNLENIHATFRQVFDLS